MNQEEIINYTTLYEAYLNVSEKLHESDYKLYQIEEYINDEIVNTKDGIRFFKYTREGSKILDIIGGKCEYKVKRKER